jgi:hypothetical protein
MIDRGSPEYGDVFAEQKPFHCHVCHSRNQEAALALIAGGFVRCDLCEGHREQVRALLQQHGI